MDGHDNIDCRKKLDKNLYLASCNLKNQLRKWEVLKIEVVEKSTLKLSLLKSRSESWAEKVLRITSIINTLKSYNSLLSIIIFCKYTIFFLTY